MQNPYKALNKEIEIHFQRLLLFVFFKFIRDCYENTCN